VISIATLNINTGHGARGEFRERLDRGTLERNLGRIADLLTTESPDIVCLQEVDFRWRGTNDIDEATWLANRAGYRYVHSCAHHRSPLPDFVRRFWPSREVVWNRDCGTAILSRIPFTATHEYTFGQTLTSNPIANHFAGLLNESKGYTFVEVEVEGRPIGIINVHLLNDIVYEILRAVGRQVRGEIFARAWQVEKLIEHVKERHASGVAMIVAGDFNSVPREDRLHHVDSDNGDPDDYRRDITMVLMRESKVLETIPALFGLGSRETIREFHTYPAIDPDRTLDYIFASPEFAFSTYKVPRRIVSDHKMVFATLELRTEAATKSDEQPPSLRRVV
jgi:endonuclease/exonuclease/phosphatase family metal-dependent hydrolase